jgi:hypothetical protein
MVSLGFFIYLILPHYGTGVDSVGKRSVYQAYIVGKGG